MSERIPAIQVEPAAPAAPSKQPPAPGKLPSAVNGPIYTRSFTGLFRNFRASAAACCSCCSSAPCG